MSREENLKIKVNGEQWQMPIGTSVAGMVGKLGLDPLRVAVERNLEIVPRSSLGDVLVENGDAYEIVHFVGGG